MTNLFKVLYLVALQTFNTFKTLNLCHNIMNLVKWSSYNPCGHKPKTFGYFGLCHNAVKHFPLFAHRLFDFKVACMLLQYYECVVCKFSVDANSSLIYVQPSL